MCKTQKQIEISDILDNKIHQVIRKRGLTWIQKCTELTKLLHICTHIFPPHFHPAVFGTSAQKSTSSDRGSNCLLFRWLSFSGTPC